MCHCLVSRLGESSAQGFVMAQTVTSKPHFVMATASHHECRFTHVFTVISVLIALVCLTAKRELIKIHTTPATQTQSYP
jgi:hypothetical protein